MKGMVRVKQIIFATGNPTKAKRFSKGLLEGDKCYIFKRYRHKN